MGGTLVTHINQSPFMTNLPHSCLGMAVQLCSMLWLSSLCRPLAQFGVIEMAAHLHQLGHTSAGGPVQRRHRRLLTPWTMIVASSRRAWLGSPIWYAPGGT